MRKIGILQPGRLGDIIMLLPIALYYYKQDYTVVWPMFSNIDKMTKDVVDYIDIRETSENVYTCVEEANKIFKQENITNILDLAATFPGSSITDTYVRDCKDGFGPEAVDQFKYRISNVPFSEKWNFKINRNTEQENNIYNLYVKQTNYVVTSLTHSRGKLNFKIDANDCQIIEMNTKHNVFYWLKVLENAKCIVCVESAISNLVDQMNFKNRKFLISKPHDGRTPPVMQCEWKKI
jgi:hypothetical protein